MNKRSRLISSVALGSLCFPVAVLAQSNAKTAPVTEPQALRSNGAGLEEIIVTAQRRTENLQRAAIAVSAVTAATLTAKVTTAENLASQIPSIVIGTGGGGANQVAIRGIGTLASNGTTENIIAFGLDGVYLSRPAATNGIFFDLARVEVLKGPQGTLYGRNATAGAVNVITNKPEFKLGGSFQEEVGNYGLVHEQGAFNIPLSDTVAVRLAGQAITHNGYLSDGYNDEKQGSGRGSLLYKPTSDVSVLVTTNYAHFGGKGSANVLSPFVDPSNPYLGPSDPKAQAVYTGFPFIPGGLPPVLDNGFLNITTWGVNGAIDWDTGAGKLTVIPSYRRTDIDYRHYSAGFEVDTKGEFSNETTLEARYATPDNNRLRAVFGGYYFHETGAFNLSFITLGPAQSNNVNHYDTRALAPFGQATYDITKWLRLIGGIRYSNEAKSVAGSGVGFSYTGALNDSKVNYRAGLEADVAPHSLLYATVATGFKAGGFYSSAPPNTYRPESLTAYTLGSKNRFFDNKLQLNLELYYWDYKDKQVTHLGPIRPGGFSLITENAGAATLYGSEMEASYLATPDDLLFANVLYNHTKYGSFIYNQTTVTGPPATSCAIRPPAPDQPAASVNVDCSGNVLQLAPKWTAKLSYTHTFNLAQGGRIVFGASSVIRSSYWLGDEHILGQDQVSSATGDFDLTYYSSRDRWTLGGFVQNVGNVAIGSQSFVQPILRRPAIGLYPPRTYGVRLGVSF